MATLKLKNHIPISGPARREATDGNVSDMRVSLGFTPSWYYKKCDVVFTEKWHKDPYYRYQSLINMKRELCKRFPSIPYWDESNKDDLATISGCYGAYVIPAVFGFKLDYTKDRWPVIDKNNKKLAVENIKKLNVNRLLSGSFVEELYNQMDVIKSKWGKIHGYLNWQGILNNAFNMRGQQIFLDMCERPKFVHFFFSLICEVMIELAKSVQKSQRDSGFYINHLCVSNCTMNMISPEDYEKFILPYDKKIAKNFERFGVHTCNWNVTPYLAKLKKLPKIGYLDMGIMSNMIKVKEMFPNARRAVMYSPVKLDEANIEEIRKDLHKIYRELAPCDVVMADIEHYTPDKRVREFIDICRNIVNSL